MTAIDLESPAPARRTPLLVLGALLSLSLLHGKVAHADACQDYTTLSFHPATYKYLARKHWDVYKVRPDDTVAGLVDKLKTIRNAYHTVDTPSFFKSVLFPGEVPAMSEFEGWVYSQVQLRWDFDKSNLLFVPNPEYFGGFNPSNPEHGSGFNASSVQWPYTAKWQKCRDGGAVGIAWYRDGAFRAASSYEQDRAAIKVPAVSDVYSYKATILDLVPADLPWLKSMRRYAEWYAGLAFGYDARSDRLTLYFHWPTGQATNTLHLHVRVNYLMPALEYHRAVMLDDLIRYMETKNKPAVEFVAEMIKNQGGLIIPPLGRDELALKDAFATAFPGPVLKSSEDAANNPFAAIYKKVMRVHAGPATATIQTVSADDRNPSAIRFGELPLSTVIGEGADITATSPFTKQSVVVLTRQEITELGLGAFVGKTVGELLACIQPYFDSGNSKASRCLKSNPAGTQLSLEPVTMP